MAWYLCSCGVLKEETPHLGDAIVSVYHVHRSARWDGTSSVVRMEEVSDEGHSPSVAAIIAPPALRS